nr:retrovirus-related Pol polyprotein from transposon TNT 1-94 [Tanacetum cinerariifolium]
MVDLDEDEEDPTRMVQRGDSFWLRVTDDFNKAIHHGNRTKNMIMGRNFDSQQNKDDNGSLANFYSQPFFSFLEESKVGVENGMGTSCFHSLEPVAHTTVEQRLARKNELKAHGTLLMALPDKHQLKFNIHKDAKMLMEAIEKRFGGNTDTKKVQKTLLKQQYENFTVRARRFLQRTRRNLKENGPTSMGFDMSKVECYNCHMNGHFARECRSSKDTRRNGAAEPQRRNVPIEIFTSNALLRDNALVSLRQNLEKANQERDDLKLKLEKFQTSSKNLSELLASQTNDKTGLGYNSQVFTRAMFDCDGYLSSGSDESLPPSPIYDMYQSGNGYHVVPPPYTGTFMPPKPDLVSDSENESETKTPQNVPSFVQPTEQVKSPRPSVQHVKTSIPPATLETAIPKPTGNGKCKNGKACFVCQILDHLIKDCDYHEKKIAQPTARNHAQRGIHKQYAQMTLPNPQRYVVPIAVVPKSKLVTINAVRTITADVPKIKVTRPRQHKPIITKPNLPTRRHINRSPSPKASNSPPRVTAVKAPVVNAAKDMQGKWEWKPKCLILDHVSRNTSASMILKRFDYNDALGRSKSDKGVIDSGCSRHMTGNMSYMSDFKELNGGYVSFGGNPNGGKISGKGLKNQLSLKVKVIRSDNGTEFKNNDLNQIYRIKGIKREFSVPKTPQQNGIAERKNRTLIEAAKTMLADSLLPILFWAKAVNIACYVNMVLVTKPQNKTPYELLHGRIPSIGFMRPFGCPVTILNTVNSLGKFDGKVDEGFLVGYSISSKAFRVFNSRTHIVQETLHVSFLENKPNITEKAREEIFQQYVLFPVWSSGSTNPQNTNGDAAFDKNEPEFDEKKHEFEVNVSPSSKFKDFSDNIINEDNAAGTLVPAVGQISPNSTNTFSDAGPSNAVASPTQGKSSYVDAFQLPDDPNMPELKDITYSMMKMMLVQREELLQFKMQKVWVLVGLPYRKRAIGTKWVFKNKKDERGIVVRNKARLVAPGHTQAKGINYEEVFAPVARIEAIRLFLAYASFMGFMVYQMDIKSAFLYGIIEEEVYVCQPPGFEDPDYPEKVYKVVKALYGLHQSPRAWYETLANYLLENGFQRGKIDLTLFIKRQKGDILLAQIYVDDIIFGSTNKDLCKAFEKLMKDKFQISSIRELTFFLGLQVKKKKDGIFISHDKYVAEILRKFGLTDGKSASTLIDTEKPLLKDPDGEDVDVHTYRSMIGSLMYLTSSRPNIMFVVCACARFQVTPKASHLHAVKRIFRYLKGNPHLGLWYPKDSPLDLLAYSDSDYASASLDRKSTTGGCQFLRGRLISWQCKKQTVVATSFTKAEYVAAASCCAQVLWIQNQLLDYGYNFMHTIIYIDNSSNQTVSGKDSSNPLMADNLPKIVWYSTHYVALMKSWLVQKQTTLGVNPPRCDVDRLELMKLTVFLLPKVEKVGVEVSAVDLQFWTTVAVKKVNDVTRLQALVDKKKVIITEATIRDALRLDDAEGVECLPNKEIFTELARMGYEKPSTKLTFYKAFFSSQLKFFIHTILQCMSAWRTSWNEFSSSMEYVVICLSLGRKFYFSKEQVGDLSSHSTKYTSPALTQKVFANMRWVGKGFSRVDTPLFKGMLVAQKVGEDADEVHAEDVNTAGVVAEVQPTPPQSPRVQPQSPQPQPQPSQDAGVSMNLLQTLMDKCTTLSRRVEHLELDKNSQALEITKLKQRVKKLERRNKLKDVVLEDAKDGQDADVQESANDQGRKVESQAEIYKIDLEHTKKVLSMQEEESKPAEIQEVVDVVTTAKIITEVFAAVSTTITAADVPIPAATTAAAPTPKSKDKGKAILKEDKSVKRYQALKMKPQTEAQARKNMMIYLKNVASFKMDYFKGMSYDDIRLIFEKYFDSNVAFLQKTKEQMDEEDSRALKRMNESQKEKAAKKQKLDEKVEELKRHLQIVPNDDDDVYTEATPLALKVPVVDYEIYNKKNKPYYKIKRADGSHQLYLSFLSLLRNFDGKDLESLWRLVKERFTTSKPKNFFDDFLLITLGATFEKPDIHT